MSPMSSVGASRAAMTPPSTYSSAGAIREARSPSVAPNAGAADVRVQPLGQSVERALSKFELLPTEILCNINSHLRSAPGAFLEDVRALLWTSRRIRDVVSGDTQLRKQCQQAKDTLKGRCVAEAARRRIRREIFDGVDLSAVQADLPPGLLQQFRRS